jgi:hypothetical protein
MARTFGKHAELNNYLLKLWIHKRHTYSMYTHCFQVQFSLHASSCNIPYFCNSGNVKEGVDYYWIRCRYMYVCIWCNSPMHFLPIFMYGQELVAPQLHCIAILEIFYGQVLVFCIYNNQVLLFPILMARCWCPVLLFCTLWPSAVVRYG